MRIKSASVKAEALFFGVYIDIIHHFEDFFNKKFNKTTKNYLIITLTFTVEAFLLTETVISSPDFGVPMAL